MVTKKNSHLTNTLFLLWLLTIVSSPIQADPLVVTLPGINNETQQDIHHYFQELLILSLQKTKSSDGDFTIQNYANYVSIERKQALLVSQAGIDVIWGTQTDSRSQNMRVISYDLVKGLNNYRFLFIRKDMQKVFLNIGNLNDLQQLTAGSGIKWSINETLDRNRIKVMTSGSFSGLFKMLAANRFDFIVRTPFEIIEETAQASSLNIVMAPNIALTFKEPQPYCFFVNKKNAALADRIERGLNIAHADGSFDLLFNSFPSLTRGEQLIANESRQTIMLE